MIPSIINRRSIRKYRDTEIPKDMIEEILRAGILAPSSKNRQPWRFVVVSGPSRQGMSDAMERGLIREESEPEQALLPDSRRHLGGARHTLQIMSQAPVTILIVNPLGMDLSAPLTPEERIYEICNNQSIGAAMENMALASNSLGLGSLWICDTFFAYRELMEWLGGEGELAAAMTLGYADEDPSPRPRTPMEQIVEWRN